MIASPRIMRLMAGVLAVVGGATILFAQGRGGNSQPQKPVDLHDLSGYWELSFDSERIPPADLAPGVTKEVLAAEQKKTDKAIQWCNQLGMPFLMGVSRPLDIRQGRREIVISPESTVAAARHLYLDRSEHPNADIWDPSANGDSIAHWEGDALVVDTTGFNPDHGMTLIPGGGYRSADAHLVEHYKLVSNGNVLDITFTWIDPKVYKTPHTYEFRYYKQSDKYEPRPAIGCNAFDAERVKFLGGTLISPITGKPLTQ
ncbi:MAG TPA: hypothetical protein VJS43_02490 [Candidatus Acidoferrales bacterium]|nr:hypothetical protein [Candidatus Acidoferrales bacterium]